MRTAKIIAWIYLVSLLFVTLWKGVPGMFKTIGTPGSLLITVAIIIVAQNEKTKFKE